jgi:hypothetical protein
MKRIVMILGLFLVVLPSLLKSQTVIETERVKGLKPSATLGTCRYSPTSGEKRFFDRLAPEQRSTGSIMEDYDIRKQQGYVSWYGIVRGISEIEPGRWRLLLEHKFFDGLTDCHIMLVDISGSGDFWADLEAGELTVPALALVRVYGMIEEKAVDRPVLKAEFVRVWPWMTFAFSHLMNTDRTEPLWKRVRSIDTRNIYRPWPDEAYYRAVLGDPKDYGLALKGPSR